MVEQFFENWRWRVLGVVLRRASDVGQHDCVARSEQRIEEQLSVVFAFVAIAETGTLMMLSGPDTPASMHLLPETHIAVVPTERVVAHYEEAFALARDERGQLPRATNLVSGPSRTGDIEQTIVLGAHGPYRVHVILVTAA